MTCDKNCPTYDQGFASIVFALNIWHQYHYIVYVVMLKDHKRLQYVFTQKDHTIRQRR